MTAREQGFLLLTSSLGDTDRKPLSVSQFRTLILRSKKLPQLRNATTVTMEDMAAMGYDTKMAQRVVNLFGQRELLAEYIRYARRHGCYPIPMTHPDYPATVIGSLGFQSPGVFWAKGDASLLHKRAVALVGSRELNFQNREFARQVGIMAAQKGYVLISGNAKGADSAAQEACLDHGGEVISIVADALTEQVARKGVLYLSEDSCDLHFTPGRALSRNRFIHCMAEATFVAQSNFRKGGTWDGTIKNLRNGWSPVYCFNDGSPAAAELHTMGARLIATDEIQNIFKTERKGESFL